MGAGIFSCPEVLFFVSTTQIPTKTSRRWLSPTEASEYLGCTDRTIRNYIATGRLRGYRMGPRSIRIDVRELDDMLRLIPTVGGADDA